MTEEIFREDAYLRSVDATVTELHADGFAVDRTVFYPLGGGQPGDTGTVSWNGRTEEVVDTRYVDGQILHLVTEDATRPVIGDTVHLAIDWERRYRHMRMHTAMHLLGSVLRYDVTGGNISSAKSRLDFDMTDAVDKSMVQAAMESLVAANHAVSCRWISEAELDANPELVRTLSVQPPRGAGRIRLLEIDGVDLQPCGGTHVRSSREVGAVRIGKVEKKGRQNRRVNLHLDD